ncbi:MAG: radical SAM family heme chaperone HemW [Clostridiales bacterium]|jgi:oxygen-independent coproporphyrinogen-3 oxidase|nr:radical SAM family heme chaperone HemW [Clostridiales bacterium]
MSNGIYIHIPFCVKKCAYCDFNSYDNLDGLKQPYTEALLREVAARLPAAYDTIFIGGGTPTALPAASLLRIVSAVAREGCEFTVEVNPATLDRGGFAALKDAGVNRISFGLQSALEDELAVLGRIHTFADFLRSYRDARDAGFGNISIDLMFSLPGQTLDKWKRTLHSAAALSPEHLSCYSLTIEEGTPFHAMRLDLPSEEEDRQMYRYAAEYLQRLGYRHYEISNFARDGYQCAHNLKYWERTPYYGFGAGAHSLTGGTRYANSREVRQYISANAVTETVLSATDIENEYIFLGLRKTDGIRLAEYRALFGAEFTEKHAAALRNYQGLYAVDDGRFRLTLDGICVSNTILCGLMT